MEHFEKVALESVQYRRLLWVWYVDHIYVVWPHGPEGYRISSTTLIV
jgi:hypothetical protein